MKHEYLLPESYRLPLTADHRIDCPTPCYRPDAATELLLDALQQADLPGKSVAEIGSGTGVVGVAAIALGARHYTGLDIDQRTIPVAEENLRRCLRGLSDSVRIRCSDLFSNLDEDECFDLVTGVLPPILHHRYHLSLLESVLLEARTRLTTAGHVLLCQRTIHGTNHVLQPFERQDFTVTSVLRQGTAVPPWHCLEDQAYAEKAGLNSTLFLDPALQRPCSASQAIQAAQEDQPVFIETVVVDAHLSRNR